MMKQQVGFVLGAKDRSELEGILRDGNVPQKIVKRVRIVLMTADGAGVMTIMRTVGISKTTVGVGRGLPLKKGRAGTMTHDYKRHGTTTLFAALDVVTGKVIGECLSRHRAKEFLKFLRKIGKETLPYLDLHLIIDNYATHKTSAVQRWLKRHPRFKLHFTPTSSSWLNLVERLFAEITRQRIRRGVFRSVPELEAAITEWINHRNAHPKPFIWTATAKSIILKRHRAKKTLANLAVGCK
jgi:transposase